MRRANIDGTIASCAPPPRPGWSACVYTSSVAALGLTADGCPADEATPIKPAHHIGAYKKSKYDAEQACAPWPPAARTSSSSTPPPRRPGRREADPHRPDDPGRGARPDAGLCRYRPERRACRRRRRRAICWPWSRGVRGEPYILGGENLMLRELLALVAAQSRAPAAPLRLPHRPADAAGLGHGAHRRAHRQAAAHDPDILTMARKKMFFSSAKARARARLRAPPGPRRRGATPSPGSAHGGNLCMIVLPRPADLALPGLPARQLLGVRARTAPRPRRMPSPRSISSSRRATRRRPSRPVIASLLAQDYAGNFRVILVDDNSTDGTAARGRARMSA